MASTHASHEIAAATPAHAPEGAHLPTAAELRAACDRREGDLAALRAAIASDLTPAQRLLAARALAGVRDAVDRLAAVLGLARTRHSAPPAEPQGLSTSGYAQVVDPDQERREEPGGTAHGGSLARPTAAVESCPGGRP